MIMTTTRPIPFGLSLLLAGSLLAQTSQPADSLTASRSPLLYVAPTAVSEAQPLQVFAPAVAPAYPTPYNPATAEEIKAVLGRIADYLDIASPIKVAKMVDRNMREPVTDLTKLSGLVAFDRTDFLITSYEWGVTYSGMLLAAEATGDPRYQEHAASRLHAIATVAAHLKTVPPPPAGATGPHRALVLRPVLEPRSLDDSGSMCAAFIKAARAGVEPAALRPWIENYIRWISTGQQRLSDGTLARNHPLQNTLWLDDLYMSVPALAQMAALTGEQKYFDDAVKQILRFSSRLFLPENNLYRHGWVEAMDPHPAFHWARANGWAIMAMTELLSVLPEDHPGRGAVMAQYRAHAAGLAARQGRKGLWHQLLDRNDSYLETSASAMFVYSIARGINRGWLDPLAYSPMVSLGWNAVAKQVNDKGQVENTCVGTGMGFDPMFYYFRPVSTFAAHGYGPVLLAGAEVLMLRQGKGTPANRSQTVRDSSADRRK